MAFVEFDVPEGRPWVSIGACYYGAGEGRGQVTVKMSRTICQQLGLRAGDPVECFRGVLGDRGTLMVTKGKQFKTISKDRTGALAFRFSSGYLGVEGSHTTQRVSAYRVMRTGAGPALVFTLPSWAQGMDATAAGADRVEVTP